MIRDSIAKRLKLEADQRDQDDQPILSYLGNGQASTPSGGVLSVGSVTNSGLGIGEVLPGGVASGSAGVSIDSQPRVQSKPKPKPNQRPEPSKVFYRVGNDQYMIINGGTPQLLTTISSGLGGAGSLGSGVDEWSTIEILFDDPAYFGFEFTSPVLGNRTITGTEVLTTLGMLEPPPGVSVRTETRFTESFATVVRIYIQEGVEIQARAAWFSPTGQGISDIPFPSSLADEDRGFSLPNTLFPESVRLGGLGWTSGLNTANTLGIAGSSTGDGKTAWLVTPGGATQLSTQLSSQNTAEVHFGSNSFSLTRYDQFQYYYDNNQILVAADVYDLSGNFLRTSKQMIRFPVDLRDVDIQSYGVT